MYFRHEVSILAECTRMDAEEARMPAGQRAAPSRMRTEGGRNCGSRFRGRTGHRPAQRRFQHAEPLLEPDRSHEPLYRHSNALDVTRILTAGKHGGAGLGRIDGQSGPWTSRLILLQRACMLEIMSWGGIHGSVSNSSPARLRPRSNESVAPMRFPLPWRVAGGQWLELSPSRLRNLRLRSRGQPPGYGLWPETAAGSVNASLLLGWNRRHSTASWIGGSTR